MYNRGDCHSAALNAVDDAVAIHKPLADKFVFQFRNYSTRECEFRSVLVDLIIFSTTAEAYAGESREI